jgi:hypothetical protein
MTVRRSNECARERAREDTAMRCDGDDDVRDSMAIVSFLAISAPSRPIERGRCGGYIGRVPMPIDPASRLRRHRFGGLVEELASEPSFLLSSMFGFLTCYLHGRLMLALADKRPPWRGLLVPTDRIHHAELLRLLPDLIVHPVLGKWLYLRETTRDFEASAARLVGMARGDDPRIGVESAPGERRRKRARVSRP